MKEIAGMTIVAALLFGVCALSVNAMNDRELFVPPPDAVAEQFTRAVMNKRWEPAREYLADPESMPDEELEALQRELGERQNVEAEVVTRDETRAVVTVRVPENNAVRNFSLTFGEEWKIE
jgi:hypothetical protein